MPHMNTDSNGSFARNSLAFWCLGLKRLVLIFIGLVELDILNDIGKTVLQQTMKTRFEKSRRLGKVLSQERV